MGFGCLRWHATSVTCGRLPDREAILDPRSGPSVHRRVFEDHSGEWYQIGEVTTEFAELECPRGALRENHPGILLGADDSIRRRLVAKGDPRIYRALPL